MNNTLSEVICIIQNRVVLELTSCSSGILVSCNLLTPFWQNVKPLFCIPQGTTDKSEAGNNFVCTLYASFFVYSCQCGAKFPFLLYVFSDVPPLWAADFLPSSNLVFFLFPFRPIYSNFLSIKMVTSCLLLISYLLIAAGDNKKNHTNYIILIKHRLFSEGNYFKNKSYQCLQGLTAFPRPKEKVRYFR